MNAEKLRQFFKSPPSQGIPLCGKCGQGHDSRISECPPKYCPCCQTVHKINSPFHYTYCEPNEHFKKWYAGHIAWVKQNTKEIWSQSDEEKEEES